MTRVCLIGDPERNLQYELLSRETSREALATYDLERPFENAIALRTVSIGAAVSLLNDLQWYLTRFVDDALVQEPSVSDEEWLSRSLAEALRNGDVDPEETAEFCKIYGLESPGPSADAADADRPGDATGVDDTTARTDRADAADGGAETAESESENGNGSGSEPSQAAATGAPRLVEPLYVRRTDGELPAYDLRDVDDTLVVRLTEAEYSP